jgi:hypothetical protein
MNSRFHSSGLAKLSAVLVLTVIAARAIAASPFQAGDILYTDSFGAVFKLNAATGERAMITSAGKLVRPYGIALEANGDVLVSDTGAQAIIRINSLTGSQTVVATGGRLGVPYGIAVDAKGNILVANGEAILRLNPVAGQPVVVSAGGRFGSSGGHPLAVAVVENGDLIVASVGSPSEVLRVNSRNGVQAVLSQGPYLKNPQAIAVSGNDIYVTDVATPDGNFGVGIVIRVDLSTGIQTLVSSAGNLVGPVGIAIDQNGQLVVGDPYTINPDSRDLYDGGIIRINPVGGAQTLIARGQENYVNPRGVAVFRAVGSLKRSP